mmetsp:Transcript_14829/g.37004  ORF Transcript_14829/g.37004 Transcript_14829/m.37004 type:complete len:208 (-) Transcript_14829:391-1014(-)
MTGASGANFMSLRVSYQFRYSFRSSYIMGAVGCQMPCSGNSTGSSVLMSAPLSAGTYAWAVLSSRFSRFSVLPPSQYCSDCTKLRASCALSEGRNLSTLGSVRTSFSRPSSKLSLFLRADLMKSPMMDLDWPSCAMEKVPSLFSFMTAGMEGKMRQASSFSRMGDTAWTILSASSSMKIREPMKMLADSTSFLKFSKFLLSRSSSSR